MAIITATNLPVQNQLSTYGQWWQWLSLTQTNLSGNTIPAFFAKTSLTILINGTWNGATATIQGSFNGTDYFPLNKTSGTVASLTADGIFSLADLPLYIMPLLSSAGASTNLNVNVFMK
jgi:hypothetical protein